MMAPEISLLQARSKLVLAMLQLPNWSVGVSEKGQLVRIELLCLDRIPFLEERMYCFSPLYIRHPKFSLKLRCTLESVTANLPQGSGCLTDVPRGQRTAPVSFKGQ